MESDINLGADSIAKSPYLISKNAELYVLQHGKLPQSMKHQIEAKSLNDGIF
jgi:hypothetical protein